ncbi:hypothetical protein HHK36_006742 [Tetracentron sinense]|uniref:Uncharacterized protein n=1 Tax=Tetracentron sinense TaxID=13715 RepID=A0A834ZHQ9_TETSI|nr:hypothetical protein HHK36_006742 [Tetracentron sinense]
MRILFTLLCCRMISYQEHLRPWKIFLNHSSGLNALDSLPCLLFLVCMRDTFIPESRKLRDPRRLYAPGRIYHIIERKFFRCGRFPPEVRTAIPVDGRFEHIVLSCNATSDHGLIWIEREAERALEMRESSSVETMATAPKTQRIERLETLEKEHKDALERAVSLNVPHAVTPEDSFGDTDAVDSQDQGKEASKRNSKSSGRRTNWNEVVEKLFNRDESGDLVLKDTDVLK